MMRTKILFLLVIASLYGCSSQDESSSESNDSTASSIPESSSSDSIAGVPDNTSKVENDSVEEEQLNDNESDDSIPPFSVFVAQFPEVEIEDFKSYLDNNALAILESDAMKESWKKAFILDKTDLSVPYVKESIQKSLQYKYVIRFQRGKYIHLVYEIQDYPLAD
ncbi:MAG: hypothetical protein AAF734_07260, partial [Bacteroidota bacterium]